MKELSAIQSGLKVARSRRHEFIKGFKYWNVEDILEAAKPLLREHSCHITVSDDLVALDGRIFVQATATVTNGAGETVSSRAYAQLCEHKGLTADQCTGVASTYARKYALNGLLAINDSQDADECAPEQPQRGRPSPAREMTPELYANYVDGRAAGVTTKSGGDLRDAYARAYSPGAEALGRFDRDVVNALVRMEAAGRRAAGGETARQRYRALYRPGEEELATFDTAVAVERGAARISGAEEGGLPL